MMQKKHIAFILTLSMLILQFCLLTASAYAISSNFSEEKNTVNIYFFWMEGCTYCEKAKPVLGELAASNHNIFLHDFELMHNKADQELFYQFGKVFNMEARYIPTIFIANQYWEGWIGTIPEEISQKVHYCLEVACPDSGSKLISPAEELQPTQPDAAIKIVTPTPQVTSPAQENRPAFLGGGNHHSVILMITGTIFGLAILIIIVDQLILRH